jgi:3-oxoacyl-[acyl-carrier protein] reductase
LTRDRVLDGKVALVTGGARGIGRSYALRLGQLGASVVVGDRNFDSAREYGIERPSIVQELEAQGSQGEEVVCDVTSQESCSALVERAVEHFGRLDIVVCNVGNAGDSLQSYASTVSAEEFHHTLALNLYGAVYVCQAATPHLKANGWGKIVNISSTAAVRSPLGGWSAPYGAAKAAVTGYTIHLAEELGAFNITVNAIAPGYIRHDQSAGQEPDDRWREIADACSMKRWGAVEDCAGALEFLCTPLSDFVTGQVIFVDGGLTIRDAHDRP